MKSVARIGTHPIHPMLVGFPIALWTASFLADLYAAWKDQFHYFGYYLALAGCIAAVVTAIPGLIDLLGVTQRGTPVRKTAWTHGLLNVGALVLFAISVWLRPGPGYITYGAYVASALGMIVIIISGWLGGALVYDHRVGVPEAADRVG